MLRMLSTRWNLNIWWKGFVWNVEGFDSVFGLFSIQFVKWWTRYILSTTEYFQRLQIVAHLMLLYCLETFFPSFQMRSNFMLQVPRKSFHNYLVMIFKIILHLWAQIAGRRYCVFKLHLMLQAASLILWACCLLNAHRESQYDTRLPCRHDGIPPLASNSIWWNVGE